MDLNEMLIFVRVVEAKSFTKAGELLSLPKSTVSRKVAALEARLGVSLIQRTTRSIQLTETGQSYFERCRRIFSDIFEADAMAGSAQVAPQGHLRVTAPPEMGNLLLTDLVNEYLKAYPQVTMELSLTTRNVDLVQEGFDLAIRMGPLVDSSLVAKKVGHIKQVLYASPVYLKKHGTPKNPAELERHQCILLSVIPDYQVWRLKKGSEAVAVPVKGRFVSNNLFLSRDMAMAGHGIVVLPEFAFKKEIESKKLVSVLEHWSFDSGQVFVAYPQSRFPNPKVRAFIDFVSNKFKQII